MNLYYSTQQSFSLMYNFSESKQELQTWPLSSPSGLFNVLRCVQLMNLGTPGCEQSLDDDMSWENSEKTMGSGHRRGIADTVRLREQYIQAYVRAIQGHNYKELLDYYQSTQSLKGYWHSKND
jgi:hypothetical protein